MCNRGFLPSGALYLETAWHRICGALRGLPVSQQQNFYDVLTWAVPYAPAWLLQLLYRVQEAQSQYAIDVKLQRIRDWKAKMVLSMSQDRAEVFKLFLILVTILATFAWLLRTTPTTKNS